MSNRTSAPKVAIPRLSKNKDGIFPDNRYPKPRVRKACDNCRKRKVRCSGEQPQCNNCEKQDMHCTYPRARKDRLEAAIEQNSRLIALLDELTVHVDNNGQKKIDKLLKSLGRNADLPNIAQGTFRERSRERKASIEERPGDLNCRDTGIGRMEEGPCWRRESGTIGFLGQNSEGQRLWNLESQTESAGSETASAPLLYEPLGGGNKAAVQEAYDVHAKQKPPEASSIVHISDSISYLDDNGLDLNIAVDPHDAPPPEIVERLFDRDMQTARTSFPILPDMFDDQFRDYNNFVKRNQSC
ncbi:hypothetical protein B0J11DRAFT_239816 [Dendryphion nanum]|uniref:Zn(2)-C6 fungal-type domain-containing protein n=1 Tax=Dendryphion nanum TaxID=256645 RepID=A0A9P9CXW0_9PLEO|nr:hypothetical protein B0J11DRAFT_239816 [Dendryphion nanum]